MLENRPINGTYGVINQQGGPYPVYAPYITSLANNYSLAEGYYDLSNNGCGSITDYIGITSGNVSAINSACKAGGNCNDTNPFNALCWMAGQNIPDRIEAAGLTWRAYMENMTRPCDLKTSSDLMYQGGHNPFLYYTDIRNNATYPTRCQDHVVPAWASGNTDGALLNDLNSPSPSNYIWLTPNICNGMYVYCPNGHNSGKSCTRTDPSIQSTCVGEGDLFLSVLVPQIMNTQAWESNSTVLFITWDEPTFDWSDVCPGYIPNPPSPSDHCQIPGIWVGPGVKQHYASSAVYQHYSLLKTLETVWQLPSLTSNDASATPMTEFFKPPAPDFSISANRTSITVNSGTEATSTIIVTGLNAFAGIVSLTTNSTSCTVSPTSVTVSGNSTLSCTFAAAETIHVTATGTSSSLSHSATVTYIVQDFTMLASPTVLTVNATTAANSTIQVGAVNGFAGIVGLSTNSTWCTLTPTFVTGSGNATLSCNQFAAGNYTVNIMGTSGTLSHTATILITVQPGSGSVGGAILQTDKLRLLLNYIPTLSLVLVVLTMGVVGRWRSKRQRERRASPPNESQAQARSYLLDT